MATYYVYHGGSGAGGTSWATAYTTLTLAFSGHTINDVYYVAHDHLEVTGAAVTLTSNGNPVGPVRVLCVDRAGSVPPVSADLRTTAIVATSGAFNITFSGSPLATYYYGITFRAGSAGSTAAVSLLTSNSQSLWFDRCGFMLNSTSNTSRINLGTVATNIGNTVDFRNCTFTFGAATGQTISGLGTGVATFLGGSIVVGATVPNALLTGAMSICRFIGTDLSAIPSGKSLYNQVSNTSLVLFQDCKLASGVTIASAPTVMNSEIHVVRSDSGDTNYRQEKYTYAGTLTAETTIVRTGGASDGTTPISWKVVMTANAKWLIPFECFPRTIWNDTTGSRTITIYGAWAAGFLPTNDQVWFDVSYLGTSGLPLASLATTTIADVLETPTNVSSDSSTWGGSLATKFKLTKTITVNEKGPMMVIVKAAMAASTVYIDPKIEVT